MYAAIRTYQTSDAAEWARRVNRGFVPILRGTPGFVAYYIINGGQGTVAAVSMFEDRAGVDESTRRAAEWVADNLAEFALGGPEVVAGEVTVAARA
jgi:hypothetical protein